MDSLVGILSNLRKAPNRTYTKDYIDKKKTLVAEQP